MSNTSGTTPWGAYKAWSRSLPVRFAMVPLAGLGVAQAENSPPAGLGMSVAMLVAVLVGLKVEDARRRRREARDHIAGLGRW
jgi:hypothetical protein